MATQKGRCVVWAVGGITYTGAGYGQFTQKVDFTRRAETNRIKDENNDNVTRIDSNQGLELNVSVIPAASSSTNTAANALSSASLWLPKIGSLMTVIDATGLAGGGVTGSWSSVYCVNAAKLSRSIDGAAQADVTLEIDEANNTTLVTG